MMPSKPSKKPSSWTVKSQANCELQAENHYRPNRPTAWTVGRLYNPLKILNKNRPNRPPPKGGPRPVGRFPRRVDRPEGRGGRRRKQILTATLYRKELPND
jgi:hypothetical protein